MILKKKIIIIFQPWRKFSEGLHKPLCENLKKLGYYVEYLDIENPPKFENKNLKDKLINIYFRLFKKDTSYIYTAEKNHYNKFNLKKISEIKNKKYDYVLIIKPDEFSPEFIKKAAQLGEAMVGYIWDGIRPFFLESLHKSRIYFDYLFSFDNNDILKYPELNLSFITNYYVYDENREKYNDKELDLYYIGALGGKLPEQRRDILLAKLLKNFTGKTEVKIHLEKNFLLNEDEKLKNPKIEYIYNYVTYHEAMEKTKSSKIVIDIRKKHHIGLSFRFFECMYYEVKLITDNETVKNYDFYRPENILIVDFDKIEEYQDQIKDFISIPYQKLPPEIFEKYSIKNWVKNIFRIGDYQKIEYLG